MIGKRYYLTTERAWQRHASRCAETHFMVLTGPTEQGRACTASAHCEASGAHNEPANDAAPILALITADEAAHVALESDVEVEALPHPLARTPVSERVANALTQFGVVQGDDTFAVAEKLARVSPLLRHRVF